MTFRPFMSRPFDRRHKMYSSPASEVPTEATTSSPQGETTKGTTSPQPSPLPFDAGDIREAFGFDRNDPNVRVTMHALGSEGAKKILGDDYSGDGLPSIADDKLNAQVESIARASSDIVVELSRALTMHGPMKSGHEGYAVLLEEVDELWDLVKTDKVKSPEGRKEAIQIAAMALRFILDVIENDGVAR